MNLSEGALKWHEFTVSALGSSGVNLDHTTDHKSSYGTLTFERNHALLSIRQISPNNDVGSNDRLIAQVTIDYR